MLNILSIYKSVLKTSLRYGFFLGVLNGILHSRINYNINDCIENNIWVFIKNISYYGLYHSVLISWIVMINPITNIIIIIKYLKNMK